MRKMPWVSTELAQQAVLRQEAWPSVKNLIFMCEHAQAYCVNYRGGIRPTPEH